MALSTKKDAIIYLLGALTRLIKLTDFSYSKYKLIYDMLNSTHKYVEEELEKHGE